MDIHKMSIAEIETVLRKKKEESAPMVQRMAQSTISKKDGKAPNKQFPYSQCKVCTEM